MTSDQEDFAPGYRFVVETQTPTGAVDHKDWLIEQAAKPLYGSQQQTCEPMGQMQTAQQNLPKPKAQTKRYKSGKTRAAQDAALRDAAAKDLASRNISVPKTKRTK